jgi:cytochrome P450
MCAPGVSAIDPDHWENPMDFYPERWTGRRDEESDEKIDFGYGLVSKGGNSPYLPFGAGRHRCIGEQFANLQLGVIISTFVREIRWTADKVVPQPDYTVCPSCDGAYCRVLLLCLLIRRNMSGREGLRIEVIRN